MADVSAIPENLYRYSAACTQGAEEVQRWVRGVLAPALLDYQNGGGFCEPLDGDVVRQVAGAYFTDLEVRSVGMAFQQAGGGPAGVPTKAHVETTDADVESALRQLRQQGRVPADPVTEPLSIPVDGGLPYELTGDPWPPSVVSGDGVFQKNERDDYDSAFWSRIYESQEQAEADTALAGMYAMGLPHAAQFFAHYLGGSGSDLNFDAAQPYQADPRFRSLVDGTVREKIGASPGQPDFDSGYLYHTAPFSTDDWHNAIGGSYYRTTGHRNPDGTWTVNLRVTSYYQFRDGANFHRVQGSDMRDLERDGDAKNFREIGTATLLYDRNGHFVRVVN